MTGTFAEPAPTYGAAGSGKAGSMKRRKYAKTLAFLVATRLTLVSWGADGVHFLPAPQAPPGWRDGVCLPPPPAAVADPITRFRKRTRLRVRLGESGAPTWPPPARRR